VHFNHLPLGIFFQFSCKGFLALRADLGFPLELKSGTSAVSAFPVKDIVIKSLYLHTI
jgi:hypothetical protein